MALAEASQKSENHRVPITEEEFGARVRRLEAYARNHPAAYRLRSGLLAALGYGRPAPDACALAGAVPRGHGT